MQTFTRRSEIPPAYTWNLESIYPSDDDWEREAQSLQRRLPELEALKGTLAQGGQALLTVLRKRDELFEEALRICVEMKRASTSVLQRRLRIGYGRAAAVLDQMEREGLIGQADGARPRAVLGRAYEIVADWDEQEQQ